MESLLKDLLQELGIIQRAFEEDRAKAETAEDPALKLEDLRVRYLGKKSRLLDLMKIMGRLDPKERPVFGQAANHLRTALNDALNARIRSVKKAAERARLREDAIDISLPGTGAQPGARHPIHQTVRLITDIFMGMGYRVADGPEIEWARYNFDLLRIPETHPSRDESDTFYVDDRRLLRTQTSGVQVRVMQKVKPPIRIICPGRVYRPDTPDATHSPIFHQIEGLVVDQGIAMSDLVGTLQLFAKELFGEATEIRLRPHHFPFTEPSCEVDVSCWRCGGAGCPTCKGEGFVEILGAGMVHPGVLGNCGIDPKVYSGFAFGIGAERTAMARFDVDDIRNFYENNVDFLKQFR